MNCVVVDLDIALLAQGARQRSPLTHVVAVSLDGVFQSAHQRLPLRHLFCLGAGRFDISWSNREAKFAADAAGKGNGLFGGLGDIANRPELADCKPESVEILSTSMRSDSCPPQRKKQMRVAVSYKPGADNDLPVLVVFRLAFV